MNIQWTLALRYLNGRKLRSFLTTLAVVFGVLVIFGMNTLIPTMLQAFQATMLAGTNNVDLTITLRTGETFPSGTVQTVRDTPGVRVAQGILSRPLNLPADYYDHNANTPDQVSAITLVGLDVETAQQIRNYAVQTGRFLHIGDDVECVISQTLADSLGLKTGDDLTLPAPVGQVMLAVVGILPARTTPGNEEVLVTLPLAQMLLDSPDRISLVEADYTTEEQASRAATQQLIAARLGGLYQFNALSNSADVFSTINLASIMLDIFGVLALFMGGFIIFNTFRTLVAERQRDLGLLRAVGASRGTIVGAILFEGLFQGAGGSLIGIALGYLLSVLALAAFRPTIQSFIHIQLGMPVVSPGLALASFLIGTIVTLLAGLIPALNAGRVTPMEALRPAFASGNTPLSLGWNGIAAIGLIGLSVTALLSGNLTFISVGAVTFLVGLIFAAPVLVRPIARGFGVLISRLMARDGVGRLAEGNLTRQPTRAAITASTTLIALAIMVAMGGLISSVVLGFMGVLKRGLGSDYLFIPPSIIVWNNNIGANSQLAQRLKSVEGVGVVSTFRSAIGIALVKPAGLSKSSLQSSPSGGTDAGMSISLVGIDPVAYPKIAGLDFDRGSPAQAYQALADGRNIIINGMFASSTGVKIGDVVPFLTAHGTLNYHVVAIASDILNEKATTAYISQASLAADFDKKDDVFIQLNLRPGADRTKVEAELKTVKAAYPQFMMISGQAYFQQVSKLLNTAFLGIYVLFIFLAVPSLIALLNTLAISVIERTREIGMLRALGATQRQIRRMILIEALLLAAVGTLFGVLAGLYLCYALIGGFRSLGMPVVFSFPWTGVLYATLVSLAAGALASIVPSRQAARLDIIQALHYE